MSRTAEFRPQRAAGAAPAPLAPPERLLMGPGPSNPDPRVLAAMGANPVGHLDPYFVELMDLQPEVVLVTHGHFDHVGAVAALKKKTGAKIYLHEQDVNKLSTARRQGLMFGLSVPDPPPPDILVADGDLITYEEEAFRVAHTPGHTPGCVSYIMKKMAFVGDLIFAGSIGRTDLPGGDYDALIRAVREKIFVLPEETVLYPGHGPPTTVGHEKKTNPFFTKGW